MVLVIMVTATVVTAIHRLVAVTCRFTLLRLIHHTVTRLLFTVRQCSVITVTTRVMTHLQWAGHF